jgi:hypothetical protein
MGLLGRGAGYAINMKKRMIMNKRERESKEKVLERIKEKEKG